MEQKLTNSEIARVFAMYLGCSIYKVDTKLIAVNLEDESYIILEDNGFNDRGLSFTNTSPKLLLTPLSLISDADAVEVAKIYADGLHVNMNEEEIISEGRFLVSQISGIKIHSRWNLMHSNLCFQYLIQKYYAVPLFFGINHWANGKSAIDLGIAITKEQTP